MRDRRHLARQAFAANKCSPANVAADQALGFEFGVGVGDGRAVHTELCRELAARGNAFAGTQISPVHQRTDLVAQLHIERHVAFGL